MPGDGELLLLPVQRPHAAEAVRWWVLLVYSYSSGLQGLLWMTYSSVSDHSKKYLHTGDTQLNLILNEGPIAYCCVVLFASTLFTRLGGLRTSILLGCFMCFFASLLRCIPCFYSETFRSTHSESLMLFVYVAQFINAAAAPFTQASPSLISQTWFPPHQRATATAIARQSNSVGRAVGFFLAPALVHTAADLPTFIYVEAAIAAVPLLAALYYLPNNPKQPPSISTQLLQKQQVQKQLDHDGDGSDSHGVLLDKVSDGDHEQAVSPDAEAEAAAAALAASDQNKVPFAVMLRQLLSDCVRLLKQPTRFVLLIAAFGLQMGVYGAWSGVLTPVLTAGGRFTDSQAGLLGSINTFAGIFGGILVGYAVDSPALSRRLKPLMLLLCAACFLSFLVLALALAPFSMSGLHMSFVGLATLSVLAGAFRGALDPLFFELSTELAFPIPAGTAGGLLTLCVHLVMIINLSLPPHFLDQVMMMGMAVTMVICGFLIFFVKEEYTRSDIDAPASHG